VTKEETVEDPGVVLVGIDAATESPKVGLVRPPYSSLSGLQILPPSSSWASAARDLVGQLGLRLDLDHRDPSWPPESIPQPEESTRLWHPAVSR
jgi:hypothetical protein